VEGKLGKLPNKWHDFGFGGLTIVSCGTSALSIQKTGVSGKG